MELLSIMEIWRWFRWLPNFILKGIFTKERLADLIIIDVLPRHESIRVNLSDVASYDMYFQIINMSPFTIELDRGEIELSCVGTRLKSQYIKKVTYSPGKIDNLYIHGDIDTAKANQIVKHYGMNGSSIDLHLEFNCKLHSFQKARHNLDGVNVTFINKDWRLKELENMEV